MMPSRLLGAFPDGVTVSRCGLAEAVDETRAFLANSYRAARRRHDTQARRGMARACFDGEGQPWPVH